MWVFEGPDGHSGAGGALPDIGRWALWRNESQNVIPARRTRQVSGELRPAHIRRPPLLWDEEANKLRGGLRLPAHIGVCNGLLQWATGDVVSPLLWPGFVGPAESAGGYGRTPHTRERVSTADSDWRQRRHKREETTGDEAVVYGKDRTR